VRRWLRWEWIPALLYMVAIFCVSALSLQRVPIPKISDKVLHGIEYGILAALLVFGFTRTRREWAGSTVALAAWSFATLYGMTDEVHQRFVPGRQSSVFDWMADAAGAAVVAAAAALLVLRRRGAR